MRQQTCAAAWYHCRIVEISAPVGQQTLPIMTMLTHCADGNVFAKPCRTNIHLIYANMHESGFILIIKMRQLCVQQIVLLVNRPRLTPPL